MLSAMLQSLQEAGVAGPAKSLVHYSKAFQPQDYSMDLNGKAAASAPDLTFGGFALADKKGTSWVSKGQELSLSIFPAKFSKVPPLREMEGRK